MRRLAFCLIFICSLWAEAPLAVYLTWVDDPLTTMEVMWLTSDAGSDKLTLDNRTFEGKSKAISELSATLHQVSLKELEPGRAYNFSVEGEGYCFKMPSKEPPIRFIVGGDCYHDEKASFLHMLMTIGKQKPDFVVFAGDLAYVFQGKKGPGQPDRLLTFLEGTTKYMRKGEFLIPFITTIGNHEVQGSFGQTPEQATLYYTLFPHEGYRKVNFNSYLSLFLLDSGHTHEIQGAQTEWLERTLKDQHEIPYRFAVYHVPAYPSVRSYTYRPSKEIRKNWVPLFEEHKLMGAFEHHDHALKRTFPLLGKEAVTKGGVVYFGDGSCGVCNPRMPKQVGTVWYLAHSKKAQSVWQVDLTKESALFRAISVNGEVLDKTEIDAPNKK